MENNNKTDNEFEEFAPGNDNGELASWSAKGESDISIDDGEVEFFSLPETETKGSKRFSKPKKGKKKAPVEAAEESEEDELVLTLKSEIESELDQEEDKEQASSSKDIDWGAEATDELEGLAVEDTELDMSGDFEADMLLVDAHNELDMELSAKKESGDFSEEKIDDDSLEDAPELVFERQSEEELEQETASEEGGASGFASRVKEELSLEAKVEAILFASPRPLKIGEILEVLGEEATSKEVSEAVSSITAFHARRKGGFALEAVRGGYQFQSSASASTYMQRMFSSRPRPISRAAQETLAIIAYRQPVTRADIEFIRGVDAGSIVKNLLDRDLIKAVGRKEDAGRPILFGTTDEFLQIYGLQSLADLPPLESFQPSSDLVKAGMDLVDEQDKPVHEGDFVGNYDDSEDPAAEIEGESSFGGASQYDNDENSDMTGQEELSDIAVQVVHDDHIEN